MLEFLDYEILRLTWWALLGVLLIAFAITDGFDLGVAMLLPFVARDDNERRVLINSIAPFWEGNQAWLILAAGAIFAAWPHIYAVSFSALYYIIMLMLIALMLRPIAFEYRSKINNPLWRKTWDWLIFSYAISATFLFGVAIGNIIQGLSFTFNEFMVISYNHDFLSMFNEFSLLCGSLSILMFVTHGACYLTMKTNRKILIRARRILAFSPFLLMSIFAAGALFVQFLPCYKVVSPIGILADSNPLTKIVVVGIGCLNDNFAQYNWMWFAPGIVFALQIFIPLLVILNFFKVAFIFSAISIAGIITTVGFSMFPIILPSKLDPKSSLTVWDASSSELTLFIMLVAMAVFVPLIVVYTSFIHRVMRGKVTENDIKKNSKNLY